MGTTEQDILVKMQDEWAQPHVGLYVISNPDQLSETWYMAQNDKGKFNLKLCHHLVPYERWEMVRDKLTETYNSFVDVVGFSMIVLPHRIGRARYGSKEQAQLDKWWQDHHGRETMIHFLKETIKDVSHSEINDDDVEDYIVKAVIKCDGSEAQFEALSDAERAAFSIHFFREMSEEDYNNWQDAQGNTKEVPEIWTREQAMCAAREFNVMCTEEKEKHFSHEVEKYRKLTSQMIRPKNG